jgi:hypothetical protein
MSFLSVLHLAATAATTTALYAACVALAVATSLAAATASLRSEGRETLKILRWRRQYPLPMPFLE